MPAVIAGSDSAGSDGLVTQKGTCILARPMMNRITRPEAVVFDFDGTIGDTRSLIIACFQGTYAELGLPAPEESAIAATIGLPLESAFRQLSGFDPPDSAKASTTYRELFRGLDFREVKPFEGMPELVAGCRSRGFPIAVASSRGHATLDPMLQSLGLMEHLSLVVDHEDAGTEKPDPEMLHIAARAFGIDSRRLVMIGDTRFDIQMGKNAGSATIGVTWGNHSAEELAALAPDLLAENPGQINDFLCFERAGL